MTTENRKWPLVALVVFVVIAGAIVGGFFGLVAGGAYAELESVRYHWWEPLGTVLGGIGGAGAGILWSWLMGRLSPQAGGARIVLLGIACGFVVGGLATVLLHLGLIIASGRFAPEMLLTIYMAVLISGAPAGLATGFVCGLLRWGVVAWLRRKAQAESAATPTDGAANDAAEGT